MKKGRTTHSNIKIKAGICRVSFRECQKNITSQYPHRYLHHKLLNLPKIQAPVMKTSILVDPLTSLKKAWAKSFQQSLSIIVTFRKAYACSCGQTTTQPMILYHRMSPWGQSSGCWQGEQGTPAQWTPHWETPVRNNRSSPNTSTWLRTFQEECFSFYCVTKKDRQGRVKRQQTDPSICACLPCNVLFRSISRAFLKRASVTVAGIIAIRI